MKVVKIILPTLLLFIGINVLAQNNPPQNFQCETAENGFLFSWKKPETTLPLGYNIYRNNNIINNTLITDLTYLWFPDSGCPSKYDIEAVYTAGVSAQESILYPEYVDGGEIEPYMINDECWGYKVMTPPNVPFYNPGYIQILFDGIVFATMPSGENFHFANPIPAGTEICVGYQYSECMVTACCTVSVSTDIREEKTQIEISLFPQPATSVLYLSSSHPLKRIELLNLTGEKIKTYSVKGAINWSANIEDLEAGLYILHYILDDNNESYRKVIVR